MNIKIDKKHNLIASIFTVEPTVDIGLTPASFTISKDGATSEPIDLMSFSLQKDSPEELVENLAEQVGEEHLKIFGDN